MVNDIFLIKKKQIAFSDFSFCHHVFQRYLLQRYQMTPASGKGLNIKYKRDKIGYSNVYLFDVWRCDLFWKCFLYRLLNIVKKGVIAKTKTKKEFYYNLSNLCKFTSGDIIEVWKFILVRELVDPCTHTTNLLQTTLTTLIIQIINPHLWMYNYLI